MSGVYTVTVGEGGRVVFPRELRRHRNWPEGTVLVAIEREEGVLDCTREELELLVRCTNTGTGVVDSLIADRRIAAAVEDRA